MPDFPRVGGATAAEVAAAILVDPATDKIDGSQIDASVAAVKAKTDALPDDPADESLVEAAIATRASATDYTADRAAKMDKIQDFLEEGNGTLTADGTEQTVREYTGTGKLHVYIDTFSMAAGDTTVIRQFMKIKAAGTYRKFAEETYSGAQALPLLHIVVRPNKNGVKVTLQQTAGTNRAYDWETFAEQAVA
jgi:hypothetical protein